MKPLALAIVFSAAALAACSKQEAPAPAPEPAPAAAPAAAPAPAPAPAPVAESAASAASGTSVAAAGAADPAAGKAVFTKTCALCHAAGVAGAPKPGDKADWGPRIAQGNDVLYKHAIEGFTGSKGTMPPKGGNTALSDAEVKAAVDYMVAQSR
jgi:cytochrome c5